ncbi:MAG: hypothetical protein M1816_005850 [Peltula sp. TS41687]|nr:MAG: hypothetical protein M1816_005850 [Peltula sp. TS41687]
MNPHQRNKIDINSLSEDEKRLFRLYGKLPNKKDLLQNKLKERKYFDSGDYALSKAGKASDAGVTQIGSQHPNPENIPHLTSPVNGNGPVGGNAGHAMIHPGHPGAQSSGSPVKESSFLHRETSVDDQDGGDIKKNTTMEGGKDRMERGSISPTPLVKEGVTIPH